MKTKFSPVGRRTGQYVVKKSVRIARDGIENFSDYWTDSSVENLFANESSPVNQNNNFNRTSKKPQRRKRSSSTSLDISGNETLSNIASDPLDSKSVPRKRNTAKKIQTSLNFNTPITEKVGPKCSTRKRINVNRATESVKKEKIFAKERTLLQESINEIVKGDEEKSIHTSKKHSSPERPLVTKLPVDEKMTSKKKIVTKNKSLILIEKKTENEENLQSSSKTVLQNKISKQMKNLSASESKECTTTECTVTFASEKKGKKRKKSVNNKKSSKNSVLEEDKPSEIRKSKRNRIAPLDLWRNERRLFKYTDSGDITCVGLIKGSEEDCKGMKAIEKSKTSKKKSYLSSKSLINFESINKNGVCFKPFECVKWSKPFQKDGKEAYVISKIFSFPSFSSGFIEIAAGCSKGEQYSPLYDIQLVICKGLVNISVDVDLFELKANDTILIPIDVPYSLHNPSKNKTLIHFTAIKPINTECSD